MIGYVTLGTNDLSAARAFYDALFADMGARRIEPNERLSLWSVGRDRPMLGVITPFDNSPATPGNGAMVALNVGSKEEVDALHAKALSLGAADEGAPGNRTDTFYGGYFRDMDGNKLVVFTAV